MSIKEIAIVSGKGGTGKTSLIASMIPYFENLVMADCDVDAPDLNILLPETNVFEKDFVGLQRPAIDENLCTHCNLCVDHCHFHAISEGPEINLSKCEGCGVCEFVCPAKAITMQDYRVGKIFNSVTEFGEMVRARLIPGEETSGKLVAQVRSLALDIAKQKGRDWILIDGSPGIACNVISSLTGVQKAIVVIEPTVSGLHDLAKIHQLISSFSIEILIVINKADLSQEGLSSIEKYCSDNQLPIVLRIPFRRSMVEAIVNKCLPSLYDPDFFKEIGFEDFIGIVKS